MQKKLLRSRSEKMIAGVCGGLAEYFDMDPVIMRIIFIAAALLTGIGFLVYLLLWIVVPYKEQVVYTATEPFASESGEPVNPTMGTTAARPERRGHIAGYILIAIGLLFLADRFIPHFYAGDFWPLILIALGIGILLKGARR